MRLAEKEQVIEIGSATVDPVDAVMRVEPSRVLATRIRAIALLSQQQGTELFVGDEPVRATNIEHVARAVVDSVREGVIAEGDVDDLCIIVGVFIHWEATDDKKIFDYNYEATKQSIARALSGEPKASAVVEGAAAARHPFAAGVEG